jgi:predicted signal transduction protein with EAL and GGDEF domain
MDVPMHYVRTIRSLFAVPADNPELARSQIQAVSRQMPLLYLIVVANTIALAATHLGTAPAVLAVYIPVLLCLFCVRRLASWWSLQRRPMSNEEAVRQFRVVTRRCALVSAALVCFALSLFPYGDAYAQAHVAFFLFSLLVGGIFCLAHLRSAALVVTLIVVVPFAAFLGATGRPVFIAVAVTVVLVATAMMSMVFAYGLILDGDLTDADILGFGKGLCEALQAPYTMPDVVARLSCSAGFATFHSGYSSLGYVHRLPIDRIKIDRSFIAEIETDRACRNVVNTMVDLCRNLDLDCVVEGVETAAQLSIVRQLGCKTAQGYYLARPMAPADVMPHLDAERHRLAEAQERQRLTA